MGFHSVCSVEQVPFPHSLSVVFMYIVFHFRVPLKKIFCVVNAFNFTYIYTAACGERIICISCIFNKDRITAVGSVNGGYVCFALYKSEKCQQGNEKRFEYSKHLNFSFFKIAYCSFKVLLSKLGFILNSSQSKSLNP